MKKIDLIDLKKFDGTDLISPDGEKTLNVKYVILNHLVTFQGKTGKENILAYTLGQRISASKGILEIEDAEYDLIKNDLERSKPIMTALVLGQTLKIFESSNEKGSESSNS